MLEWVTEKTEEALEVLSNGFFSRTDGPLMMTEKGCSELTLWGNIYNNREKTVLTSINEDETRTYKFSYKGLE